MPSISVTIAPSPHKLLYFNFFSAAGNILPLKKHHPASVDTKLCDLIGVRNLSNYFLSSEHIYDNDYNLIFCTAIKEIILKAAPHIKGIR